MIQTVSHALRDKEYFIFDLDRTLIDPFQAHKQGLWEVVKTFFPGDMNFYQDLLELTSNPQQRGKEDRRRAYSYLSLVDMCFTKYCEEEFLLVDRIYWKGVGDTFVFYEDTEEVLMELADRNKSMSIVTNGGVVQHKKLEHLSEYEIEGMLEFDFKVVTGDYGKEAYKPSPKCLNKVINFYGAERSKCVYIGDSLEHDYSMAKNAGVDFVWVDRAETPIEFEGMRVFDLRGIV